jgi:hypothetical protein
MRFSYSVFKFQFLIYTKHSTTDILKILYKFAQVFEIFYLSPFSPKAHSITNRCHQKRVVKFSVVFTIVRFQIILSVFGKRVESNFAFSAKARS